LNQTFMSVLKVFFCQLPDFPPNAYGREYY
jgi:hypothetical protein